MPKENSVRDEIQNILTTKDFGRLDAFTDSSEWTKLAAKDRQLLAEAFVTQGEEQLARGDSQVYRSFEAASKLAPRDAGLWYRQAVALADHKDNGRCLELANKAFLQSTACDPSSFTAWKNWGKALSSLGCLHEDSALLQEADEKFTRGLQLLKGEEVSDEEIYWPWARCWVAMATLSGEAVDWSRALEKFEKAAGSDTQHPRIWIEFGDATSELAKLVDNPDLEEKALARYRMAVKLVPDSPSACFVLGTALKNHFEMSGDEDSLDEADQCFTKATEVSPESVELWVEWGQLLSNAGKLLRDPSLLERASKILEEAHKLDPKHALVLSYLAEVEMLLGGSSDDRLDLLRSAEDRILQSLEIVGDDPDSWYVYGACLNELGRYFSDTEHYEQAIDRFRYGLTLDEEHPMLWYGLALSHYALGEMTGEVEALEKAVAYCAQAVHCGENRIPQFWNDWGLALMRLGERTHEERYFEAAVQRFEQVIKSVGGPEFADLDWLYNYGCALDFLGDFREDEKSYEKAVQILTYVVNEDPDYTHAQYNLGLALSHYGEVTGDLESLDRAMDIFAELLKQDSEDEIVNNDWGMTLMHKAQMVRDPAHMELSSELFAEAEVKLMKALALGSTGALYNMACLHSLTGHLDVAMHFLERAQVNQALPPVDDMLNDQWLGELRQSPSFRDFIGQWVNLDGE